MISSPCFWAVSLCIIPCELLHYLRELQLLLMQNRMLGAHRGGNLGYMSTVPVEVSEQKASSCPVSPLPQHTQTQYYPLTSCEQHVYGPLLPKGLVIPVGITCDTNG